MIKDTDASSKVDASQSAAQTGAAQGGVQSDAGAGYRSAGAETIADIGQAEAYIKSLKSDGDAAAINMKRLVEMALNRDAVALTSHQRHERNAEDFDHALRQTALQAVQAAVSLQNRVNNSSVDLDTRVKNLSVDHDARVRALQEGELARTVRHSDLAIDRQWNVDEVAQLVAKTPVFLDAIAAAVAAAVTQSMANKEA